MQEEDQHIFCYNGTTYSSDLLLTYIVQIIPVHPSFSSRVCGHRGTSHCNCTGQFTMCPALWESYRLFPPFDICILSREILCELTPSFLDLVYLGNQQSCTIVWCAVCEITRELLRMYLGLCQLAVVRRFTPIHSSVIHSTETESWLVNVFAPFHLESDFLLYFL